MTNLSEDPTYLAGLLLLLAGVFLVALNITQQGKYLIRAGVMLGLALAVVAVEWFWVTDNRAHRAGGVCTTAGGAELRCGRCTDPDGTERSILASRYRTIRRRHQVDDQEYPEPRNLSLFGSAICRSVLASNHGVVRRNSAFLRVGVFMLRRGWLRLGPQ